MFGVNRNNRKKLQVAWQATLPDHVISLSWSGDGAQLAAAASTGEVTLFQSKLGQKGQSVQAHSVGTLAVAWSPRSDRLATAGMDRRTRLWDRQGSQIAELEASSDWVEHLAWHPDGSLLAASSGRTVHLWDQDGSHLTDLTDHPSTISDLSWKPNSRTLSALVYGGVMNWTLRDNASPTFKLYPWKGSPLKMAWSPNGSMLAHGNQDATVHFWYAETAEELQMWGYSTKVRELSWDHSSRYLATGGGSVVCVWDCGGTGPEGTKPTMLQGHDETRPVSAVQFQYRRNILASGGLDGRVCLWNPHDLKRPLLAGHVGDGSSVTCLEWAPNDQLLAVGYDSGSVQVLKSGS